MITVAAILMQLYPRVKNSGQNSHTCNTQEKRKVREAACLHFSEVKTAFLKDEMPVLVELAKQLKAVHEKGMDKERTDGMSSFP